MNSNRSLPFDIPGKNAAENEKGIPDKLYFRISEVSKLTGLEPYVLRYWETEFKFIIIICFAGLGNGQSCQ